MIDTSFTSDVSVVALKKEIDRLREVTNDLSYIIGLGLDGRGKTSREAGNAMMSTTKEFIGHDLEDMVDCIFRATQKADGFYPCGAMNLFNGDEE